MVLAFLNQMNLCTWWCLCIPAQSSTPVSTSWLLPSFIIFGFCHNFLVHPHRLLANIASLPAYETGPLPSLKVEILENQPALLDPSSLQGHILMVLFQKDPSTCKSLFSWSSVVILLFALLKPCKILNFSISCSLQKRLPTPGFKFPSKFSLFISMWFCRVVFCWLIDHFCHKWTFFPYNSPFPLWWCICSGKLAR